MNSQQQASKTPISERDEWATPQYVFDWARNRWGCDFDLAASVINAKCDHYWTKGDNALGMIWDALAVDYTCGWCNPPYSNITPWLESAADYARIFPTVFLLPSPNGEQRDELIFSRACEIVFIVGRLAFINTDGNPVTGNTRGSMLVYFDDTNSRDRPHIESMRRDVIKKLYDDAPCVAV